MKHVMKKIDKSITSIVPFHYMNTSAAVGNQIITAVSCNTAFSSRVTLEGDIYQFWRCRELEYRLHPSSDGGTGRNATALAFYPGIVDTAPATLPDISENVHVTYSSQFSTVPSQWVRIPHKSLRGEFPWYKTIAGSQDISEEVLGFLCAWSSNATGLVTFEWRGIIEFKDPVDDSNTPLLREARRKARELRRKAIDMVARRKLLGVITIQTPGEATATPRIP
jgi:hypothetical protein